MSYQQQLIEVLVDCLNQNKVQQATARLLNLSKESNFCQTILTIIFQQIKDEPVLIMTLTTYKNYLKEYYNHKTQPMSQSDKQLARSTCQQLYFKIAKSNVAVNVYKEIIYILIAVSYPWAELDLTKSQQIQPNAYIFGQIGHIYQYLVQDQPRQILQKTVQKYYPMIQGYIQQVLENYKESTAKLLTEYFNMFYCAMHMQLPKYLRNFSKISTWLLYIKSVLNYPVPQNSSPQNPFLKNQIQASQIIRNIIYQHCKENEDQIQWVNQFVNTFVPDIFSTVVTLLFTKKQELNEDVLSNLIRTIYCGYKNSLIRPLIINLAERILFEQMLPLVDIKPEDFQYFNNDALQFIRRQEDSTINPCKWAAIEVIKVLIYFEYQGKSFLMRFIQYAASILKDPASSIVRRTTVMLLISQFKTQVLKNKILRKQFGQLLTQYFFPYLMSSNAIQIYAACSIVEVYLLEVNLQNSLVQQLIAKLYDCLNHSSTVVRFISVLAFTSLLQDDSDAIEFVRPHFQTILKIYLKLIEDMDHQDLLKALEKMVKYFGKEILSVGPQLIKHLITMFYKYAQKDKQDDQEEPGFLDDPASASLSTIRQLLDVNLEKATYYELSKDLIDVLAFIIKKNLKNCYQDGFQIFVILTFKATELADFVFPYLLFRKLLDGVFYQNQLECENLGIVHLAQKADSSYSQSILSILKNLIVKMPRYILFSYPLPKTPDLILCMIENKILSSQQFSTLDTSEVTGNWVSILQAYSSVLYGVGTVNCSLQLIKSFPSHISFYPWLSTVNDMNLFLAIIRKVMNRYDEDDDNDTDGQENVLTTAQMLAKYANEEDDESDFQDGACVDDQSSYSYYYNSPFSLKNDVITIQGKVNQLSNEMKQQLGSSLGKNEYSKLEKMLNDPSQFN